MDVPHVKVPCPTHLEVQTHPITLAHRHSEMHSVQPHPVAKKLTAWGSKHKLVLSSPNSIVKSKHLSAPQETGFFRNSSCSSERPLELEVSWGRGHVKNYAWKILFEKPLFPEAPGTCQGLYKGAQCLSEKGSLVHRGR